MKSFRGKKQVVKVVKFDTITGESPDGTKFELNYSQVSKRYNLYSGDCTDHGLVLSHVSLKACKDRAVDKEIVWK